MKNKNTDKAFSPLPLRGYGGTCPLSQAFTLIEVLMAMSVLTFVVFIVSNLQIRQLNRVTFERDRIEHIFLIKRDLFAHFTKPPEEGKKNINTIEDQKNPDNNVKLVTHIENIQSKSSLKELKKYIKILTTDATWKKGSEVRELSMMSLVFKPAMKEKK